METTAKNNNTLIDIVFQNRNKEYGAYALRQQQDQASRRGLLGGLVIVSAALLSSFVVQMKQKDKPIEKYTIVCVLPEPNIPEFEPPKNVVKNTIKAKSIQFTIPEIEADVPPKDPIAIPTQSKLDNTAISNETVDGPIETIPLNSDPGEVTAEAKPILEEKPVEEKPLDFSEKSPEFPGGTKALNEFLQKNLIYPNTAINAGVQGKVFLSFVVSKTGKVLDIKIDKGIGFRCDEEALRVVSLMPHWIPAENNRQKVSFRYRLPIVFQLQE